MNTNFGGSKPNWKVFMLFSLTLEENARTKQQEEQAEIQRRIYNQNPNHIPRPTRNQTRIKIIKIFLTIHIISRLLNIIINAKYEFRS